MSAVACRCVRCKRAETVNVPPGVNVARYLMAYACGACGKCQVRRDIPAEPITQPELPEAG